MALDKDLIRNSLTEDDIKLILKDLGNKDSKKDNKGNPIFQTLCHGGHNHKLYYYTKSKMFHCYTDCGDSFDIFELVVRSKNKQGYDFTFYDAVKHVASLTGKIYSTDSIHKSNDKIDDWNWISRYKRKEKKKIELPVYDERVMEVFLPYGHEIWEEEGISLETQRKYNICYYQREDRIIIPHYSIENKLIGIRGRSLRQEDIDNGRKYMPTLIGGIQYSHPTMVNLYGIHKTKEAVGRLKKAILFEGEKSCLKCEEMYQEDNYSCAVSGSNISTFQRDILLSQGVEHVIIAFDKQYDDHVSKEAEIYAEKIKKIARKLTPYFRVSVLWDQWGLLGRLDSPIDKGQEVLEFLMQNKIELNTIDEVIA